MWDSLSFSGMSFCKSGVVPADRDSSIVSFSLLFKRQGTRGLANKHTHYILILITVIACVNSLIFSPFAC